MKTPIGVICRIWEGQLAICGELWVVISAPGMVALKVFLLQSRLIEREGLCFDLYASQNDQNWVRLQLPVSPHGRGSEWQMA